MVELEVATAAELSRLNGAIENVVYLNRAILECAGEGIYGLNLNGITTFANPAATSMTGWALDELLGRPQHAVIHHSRPDGTPYPRESCPIYAALWDGQTHHRDDEVFWRKNGTRFPVAYTSTPLRINGELVGAVVVFRDITARKNRERWDANYKTVLELINSGAPLEQSFRTLVAAVEDQQEGLSASIVLHDAGSPIAAPNDHDLAKERGDFCWWRPILSVSGAVLGSFAAWQTGVTGLRPAVCEVLDMACVLARIAIEHQNLLDRLAHQSTHDALTGLGNRLLFEDRLEQALGRAGRVQGKVAVFLIDLYRLKEVNDAYGREAGDAFVAKTASLIRSVLRDEGTLARVGGDEFAVIIPEIAESTEVVEVALRMSDIFRTRLTVAGREIFGNLSVGVSIYPEHGKDSSTLQKNAAQAMERAKAKGVNRFEIFDPETCKLAAVDVVRMEALLREALEKSWFHLAYQPQFEAGGKLGGMEALLRLQPPGESVIAPGTFIPVAEETGLIVAIGEWALREACRQGVEWRERGYAPLNIAVNVSVRQMLSSDFADSVAAILAETGFSPAWLDLEITESCLMTGVADSFQQLSRLREMGVQVSIDDFGTGYSCFSRLHQLPIDTIKIDKQFIDRLTTTGGFEVVEAIASLAGQLGLRIIAEGVETGEQLDALNRLGSIVVQGFLLGRPERATVAVRHLV